MPHLPTVLEILTGGGIVAMLWSIRGELGCIKAELRHLGAGFQDHEERIRSLEQDD